VSGDVHVMFVLEREGMGNKNAMAMAMAMAMMVMVMVMVMATQWWFNLVPVLFVCMLIPYIPGPMHTSSKTNAKHNHSQYSHSKSHLPPSLLLSNHSHSHSFSHFHFHYHFHFHFHFHFHVHFHFYLVKEVKYDLEVEFLINDYL